MSSTFSSCARERSANGYARRTSCVQVVDRDLLVGADRDDLLREHVERVARDDRLLDLAVEHRAARRPPTRAGRRGTSGRCGPSRRRRARGPARPIALQAARDRLRRLDLDHEVDRAHVDAELERRRRDEARDARRAFSSSSTSALLARERAVVRARDLLARASSLRRSASRSARRRLLTNTIVERCSRTSSQDLRVDRRPDRACCGARVRLLRRGCPAGRRPCARLAHVLERDDDLRSSSLRVPASTSSIGAAAGDEAADLLERPLRRRQADALERRSRSSRSSRSSDEREVRAALRAGDGVHLVEDQRLDVAQHLARRAT